MSDLRASEYALASAAAAASNEAGDTIAAIATPAGAGGIGIVRLSGPQALAIAQALCRRRRWRARHAHYVRFYDADGQAIDEGIALWFAAPASFTGETVVELHAHGSPVLLRLLLQRCGELGARMARAGEFSERAYRNGKLDLAQAEAIADVIAAGSEQAARAARRALEGAFSQQADALAAQLLRLRVQVEATIDFADEPLETLGGAQLRRKLTEAVTALEGLLRQAQQGARLREGIHAVIIGPPNAGKSSLLNALAGSDRAIVTDIAGTTRDLLRESVRVDGTELTLVDTAGLRDAGDAIESEGMRRARQELQRADLAMIVLDARDPGAGLRAVADALPAAAQRLWLYNKSDLLPAAAPAQFLPEQGTDTGVRVSARSGEGLAQVRALLRGWALGGDAGSDAVSARMRHVQALQTALQDVQAALRALDEERLELAAEALRHAHDAVGEIGGKTLPDALLGEIFAQFCVGK